MDLYQTFENVENVIFWALEAYAKGNKGTWGKTIAYAIKERILEEERAADEGANILKKGLQNSQYYRGLREIIVNAKPQLSIIMTSKQTTK